MIKVSQTKIIKGIGGNPEGQYKLKSYTMEISITHSIHIEIPTEIFYGKIRADVREIIKEAMQI